MQHPRFLVRVHTLISLAAALVLLAGCPDDDDADDDAGDDDTSGDDDAGDDDSVGDGPWDGGYPVEQAVDGQLLIDGSFDGSGPLWWALDTGAARTYVDSDITGTTNNVTGDVVVGPLEFPQMQVGSVELDEAEAFIGWDLGGLAGQNIFTGRFSALDYKALQAHFLDEIPSELPPGVSDDHTFVVPYELPSSIPVGTVVMMGAAAVEVPVIIDTGSGVTIITQEVFDQLYDGTMPALFGYVWATNYGSDDAFVTRIPSIEVGDGPVHRVEYSWAVVIPTNNHLFPLLEGVGIFCDGFLGYPFYREFVVGVDGYTDEYVLWPYDDLDHVDPDEWHRVGIEPSWRGGSFFVEMLFSPSDAETQGLLVGDEILQVDGTDLSGSTADDLKLTLRGTPGDILSLTIDRGQGPQSFAVEIEDLLPEL